MNIAEHIKEYYEHKDFEQNYVMYLGESAEKCIDKIQRIFKRYPDFNDFNAIKLSYNDARRIYEYVIENIDDFVGRYSNYYVGDNCIDAIPFGEQEEQISSLYNHNTGKPYTKSYLKKVFDKEGFYVSQSYSHLYAYYNLESEGMYIKMIPENIPFFDELLEKYQ